MHDLNNLLSIIEKGGKTIAAVQWAVGDELVRLIGRRGDVSAHAAGPVIDAAVAELKKRGNLDYSASTLRARWKISSAFGRNRRHSEWSYGVHADAKDPDVLDAIVANAPKGQGITQGYVREMMHARQVAVRRAVAAEKARREARKIAAEAKKRAAEREAKRASSSAERERLKAMAEEADREIRENAVAPTPADVTITHPTNEELPALLAGARLAKDLANLKYLTSKLEEDYAPYIDGLTKNELDMTIEYLNAISDQARAFANRLIKGTSRRGHMSIVA